MVQCAHNLFATKPPLCCTIIKVISFEFMITIRKVFLLLLASSFCKYGNAQLCQGSLGDPLINITFGAGNNPGPPLAAAATGYQYSASDCPQDGLYTVRNNTLACFGNSWHSVPSDHTGDPNGYFMIINATVQPSPFYIDTVRGLCANSTFEFAAWILNIIKPSACNGNTSQPNITFTIERTNGTIIQSYNSNNIPPSSAPVWQQFGFFFNTPAGVSDVVLKMVNNAVGGCGNDLLLDDITFRPCGPKITPSITGEVGDTVKICAGTAKTLNISTSVSAGFNNPVFQWQALVNGSWVNIAGETSTNFVRSFPATTPAGNYFFRLAAAEAGNLGIPQCRIFSKPVGLIISDNPQATATNNGPLCYKSTIQLSASGGQSYLWRGPAGFTSTIANPFIANAQPVNEGNYLVTVTNVSGCSAVATTTVALKPTPVAAVNAATDQICENETLQLQASGGDTYQWTPAAGLSNALIANPLAVPAVTTRYVVTTTIANGCSDTASINIIVNKKAIANAGPDRITVTGSPVQLLGSVTNAYASLFWNPATDLSNPTILQPTASPTSDAQYVLTVVSNNNCGNSSDSVLVKLFSGVFVPNAFTPNGDNINSTWNISSLNAFPDFELRVFDRYGQVVFENRTVNRPWDGTYKGSPLAAGAYVYIIKYNKGNVLKGSVMIIR